MRAKNKITKKSPDGKYKISWDKGKNECVIKHKNGMGGEVSCGLIDSVFVFYCNIGIAVLSINYPNRHVSLDIYSGPDGPSETIVANKADIDKIFGKKFPKTKPKEIADRLIKSK